MCCADAEMLMSSAEMVKIIKKWFLFKIKKFVLPFQ